MTPARATRGFPKSVVAALDAAKILGVRAGDEHRFTGVWVVVVEGRVFVRSWNDKPTGWYRAFVEEPRGSLTVGAEEVAVRARGVRSERLRRAVSRSEERRVGKECRSRWSPYH